MAGFGSMFGGMKSPAAGQPGSPSFVGPMPKNPWWQSGMQQIGQFQQEEDSEGIPGLTAISKGLEQHQLLKNQGKLLHTQTELKKRSSRAAQRGTIGKQVSMTGASGVRQEGSTLDLINQTNLEFELDQAVMQHSYKLQRDAMDRAGDKARMQGIMKGVKELAGFGMSF